MQSESTLASGESPLPPAELDHVILLTPRLEAAVRQFEAAGFAVRSGGRFPPNVPFHNALVGFEGDLYIELLGIRRPLERVVGRIRRRLGLDRPRPGGPLVGQRIYGLVGERQGLVDLCVRVSSPNAAALESASGCRWETVAMQRETPTGELAAWELAFPADPRLPFVICDHTPRVHRIPAMRHPNGVDRIAAMELTIADLGQVAPAYRRLLGFDESLHARSQGVSLRLREGIRNGVPPIGITLTLAGPSACGARLGALGRAYGLRFATV